MADESNEPRRYKLPSEYTDDDHASTSRLGADRRPERAEYVDWRERTLRDERHDLEAMGRKKSTIEGYRSALTIHLTPFFKDKPVDRITREDVERFIAHERRAGRVVSARMRGRRKVTRQGASSPKSIQNYLGVLYGVFELAIRRGWTSVNPVKHAERPIAQSSTEIRFLAMVELEALLRAVPDDDLGTVERVMQVLRRLKDISDRRTREQLERGLDHAASF